MTYRGKHGLVLAALLAGAAVAPAAQAAIITITVEGTLSSGRDDFNYFGAGTSLAGQQASIVFTFDDETPDAYVEPGLLWGYGPDRSPGSNYSPGSAIATINGVQLDIGGDYRSQYGKNIAPGTATDDIQAIAYDDGYVRSDSGEVLESYWRYGYVYGYGPELLDSIDLRESLQLISGQPGVFLRGYIQYQVWDYVAHQQTQYVDAMFDTNNMVLTIEGPDDGVAPPGGVPEPASWALMMAGFGLAGGVLRHRSSASVRFA